MSTVPEIRDIIAFYGNGQAEKSQSIIITSTRKASIIQKIFLNDEKNAVAATSHQIVTYDLSPSAFFYLRISDYARYWYVHMASALALRHHYRAVFGLKA